LVEIFLLNGADVNTVNNVRQEQNTLFLRTPLTQLALINNQFMETPLHDAAGKGHTNIVERLLQVKGIKIDLQTDVSALISIRSSVITHNLFMTC